MKRKRDLIEYYHELTFYKEDKKNSNIILIYQKNLQ